MSRLFTFLLWLTMLALPMQGFAAASMQYCGKGAGHTVFQAPTGHETRHVHSDASSEVGDHAMHAEATQVANAEQSPDQQINLPDATHKCGVCASCCNLVGMTTTIRTVAVHAPFSAGYIEHSAPIYSIPSALPEKPPRA